MVAKKAEEGGVAVQIPDVTDRFPEGVPVSIPESGQQAGPKKEK